MKATLIGGESQQSQHQLWGVLQVLLTDLDEVTPLLEFNVTLNRARGLKMDVKVGRLFQSLKIMNHTYIYISFTYILV